MSPKTMLNGAPFVTLEDALAETLAWYRVAQPSHPGYANRAKELAIAGGA